VVQTTPSCRGRKVNICGTVGAAVAGAATTPSSSQPVSQIRFLAVKRVKDCKPQRSAVFAFVIPVSFRRRIHQFNRTSLFSAEAPLSVQPNRSVSDASQKRSRNASAKRR
jgi:hypothetical protein